MNDSKKKQPLSDIKSNLSEVKKLSENLDKQLADLKEKALEKNIDLQSIFGNLNDLEKLASFNITQDEIVFLENKQKELQEQVEKLYIKEGLLAKKNKENLTKERKAKFLGTRNKWMAM